MSSEVSNNNVFTHSGIISKITGNSVIVSLEQNIHCDSCRAKAACGISESTTKDVEIMNSDTSFKINEQVNVVLKRSLGFKAVFWAYIFPFILMFFTLIITSGFLKEWLSGTLSLLILLPYYLLLYYFKSTLKSAFNMSVLKI
ncbi:MAG: SoxR reducing system RseC family protein [Algibacter sp.]|uniref:SoxR reducing system RseC family protein n=1 Tax=Algibacter sp. TaxID=1872428 RepID=UPI00262DE1BE|nr:SoxR reducing system RseC family protein [Algibacter sp.]MDG1728277.1 SoxR reducing system RseC family protein [Algibacter sp.]MDG2178235.1 SoxR reducing system RseC family protein [Algibacter sp.]